MLLHCLIFSLEGVCSYGTLFLLAYDGISGYCYTQL